MADYEEPVVVSKGANWLTFYYKSLKGLIPIYSAKKDKDLIYSYLVDENYIIVYYQNKAKNIPINVVSALNLHDESLVDLSDRENKLLITNMFFPRYSVKLNVLLELINYESLGICDLKQLNEFKSYLSGNKNFSDEELVNYVIKKNPFLRDYDLLDNSFSIKDYVDIESLWGNNFLIEAISYDLGEKEDYVRKI